MSVSTLSGLGVVFGHDGTPVLHSEKAAKLARLLAASSFQMRRPDDILELAKATPRGVCKFRLELCREPRRKGATGGAGITETLEANF